MEALQKLWEASEEIFKEIEISVNSHYSGQKGFPVKDDWEKIVAIGFFTALNKMKAILYLTNPSNNQIYFMESTSLARNLWEIWLTLAWLNHQDESKRDERTIQFHNDSIIDQEKLNQAIVGATSAEVSEDAQWVKAESQRIKEDFPKEKWKMPNKFKLLEDIVSRDERFKDSLFLYYNIVYKDFSHYVHFTWRTISEIKLAPIEKEMVVCPHQDLGFKCLDISCGFFIFITEIWNNIFKIIPDENFDRWSKDWLRIQGATRGLPR